MYVIWRVKSELRGLSWNKLTAILRREIIEKVLLEAIAMAEWLYSNVDTSTDRGWLRRALGWLGLADPVTQEQAAALKRKAALTYAARELRAAGAARQDLRTLDLRLEKVISDQHPGKVRFDHGGVG